MTMQRGRRLREAIGDNPGKADREMFEWASGKRGTAR